MKDILKSINKLSNDDLRVLRIDINNLLIRNGITSHQLEIDTYLYAEKLLKSMPKQQGKRNDLGINNTGKTRYDIVSSIVGVSSISLYRFFKIKEMSEKYSMLPYYNQLLSGEIVGINKVINLYNEYERKLAYNL